MAWSRTKMGRSQSNLRSESPLKCTVAPWQAVSPARNSAAAIAASHQYFARAFMVHPSVELPRSDAHLACPLLIQDDKISLWGSPEASEGINLTMCASRRSSP